MQVDIIITATNTSKKKVTTTISYVRPEASNTALNQLAQALNALTTNTFVKVTKETESVL